MFDFVIILLSLCLLLGAALCFSLSSSHLDELRDYEE